MKAEILNQDTLRRLLRYDPETGVFTWLVSTGRRCKIGDVAGSVDSHGQRVIGVQGRNYKAHRLAWLYMTGAWPEDQIDHRNGERADNRWANLRDATHSLNQQNQRKARANNRTGLLGVRARQGKFEAAIGAGGKQKYLGSFSTPEEAHAAYLKAKRCLHAGCTI